jgi:ubiquinone biosynthesis monooxygenase Coq7
MPDKHSAKMLRVDQAGEYGAKRIYAGQLAVMGSRAPNSAEIAHMASQEAAHLERFDKLLAARRVRPTALQPLWDVAGFALGAASAFIGPQAAMACTVAIEEEIDRHYTAQLDALEDSDPEFSALVFSFRDDERAHRAAALSAGAEQAPLYPLFTRAIRLGCRLAIRLSEKV